MSDQKVYVYKIVVHNGGTPCVHDMQLSLAICKPAIRRAAQPGDLIYGVPPREGPCQSRRLMNFF